MPSVAEASAALVEALKRDDTDALAAAIETGAVFDTQPGDDRQRLRGTLAAKP